MKTKRILSLYILASILLTLSYVPVFQTVIAQEQPKIVLKRPLLSGKLSSINWNYYTGNAPSIVKNLILELLTHHFRSNGTYLPCLAESWSLSEDYLSLEVTLKQRVKFHDGHFLTADDLITSMYIPYLFKDRLWYFIASIEKINEYTVRFNFKEPTDYPVFYILWHWPIVSHTQYGAFSQAIQGKIEEGYDIFNPQQEWAFVSIRDELARYSPETLIGCGPFKVKSVSEDLIILEKFDEYFGGAPPVDEIHLIRYDTRDEIYAAAINGDIDYLWEMSPPPDIVKQIKSCPFAWTIEIPRDIGTSIYINSRVYPLSLVEVRRALAYGIDRYAVALVQYPGARFVSEYVIGWNAPQITRYLNQSFIDQYLYKFKYEYNPTVAEGILQSLGFSKDEEGIYVTPNGTRLEFELGAQLGSHITYNAANEIAEQLRKIGIKLNIRHYDDYGMFYQGAFQLMVLVYGDPKFSFDEIYHKYLDIYPGHGLNRIQYVPWREEPVDVIELAREIGLYPVQLSKEELTEIYSELSYITGDQLPTINLYQPGVLIYMNRDKFEFPTDPGYWNGLGSYEAHGFHALFSQGWLRLKHDMSIESEPSTIAQGGSTSCQITVSVPSAMLGTLQTSAIKVPNILEVYERPVSLSITGLPEGATATFTPEQGIPPFTSILFITTSSQTPPGTYPLYVVGTVDKFIVCKQEINLIVAPISVKPGMTDSDFNPITSFDVVFTPDKPSASYKLVATNPGSYFYNLIVENVGSNLLNPTITVNIPNEFVLKGAMPIHVFTDMARIIDITSSATILIYGKTVSITMAIQPESLVYITIHLDFALKGTTGYSESDCTSYMRGFKILADIEDSENGFSVKNIVCTFTGVGQKVTAIGGFALDTNMVPKSGLKVEVYDGSKLIGTSPITPSDGFYFLTIQPGGPYTVKLVNPTTGNVVKSSSVSVEKYEYKQVDFLNLNPADPAIEGYVFDSNMNGIGGITIELYNKHGKLLASTQTGTGGKYVFRFPAPGTYVVKAIVPSGYACDDQFFQIDVRQFETIRVDFIFKK
ncbi:MAG: ABC transporter substrate-binding protein [Thermoproteota archaeon]